MKQRQNVIEKMKQDKEMNVEEDIARVLSFN